MKKMMLTVLAILLGFGAVGGQAVAEIYIPGWRAYDYKVVNQSSHAEMAPGESVILWVQLENTGYQSWYTDSYNLFKCGQSKCGEYRNPIHLGTTRSQDRSSLFHTDGNWISKNRVHEADGHGVEPGETISFGFIATAPTNLGEGKYREYFAPVIENETWMADKGLYWDVTVKGQAKETYQAEVVAPNDFEYDLQAGETQEVGFAFKNTGNTTWYNGGHGAIHLATVNPIDNYSDLYFDSWMAPNRPAYMEEQIVRPGEIGHFAMVVQAPDEPIHAIGGNRYYDEYWLVAEGKTWFDYYWGYTEPAKLAINVPSTNQTNNFSANKSSIKFYPSSGVSADGFDQVLLEIVLRDKNNAVIPYKEFTLQEESCPSSRSAVGECELYFEEKGTTNASGVYQKYISKTRHQEIKYKYWVDNIFAGESEGVFFSNVFTGGGLKVDLKYDGDNHTNSDWNRMIDMVDYVKMGLEKIDSKGTIWGFYWSDNSVDNHKNNYDWVEYTAEQGMIVTYNKYNPNNYTGEWTDLNIHKILVVFDDVESATVLIQTMDNHNDWDMDGLGNYDYHYIYAGKMNANDLADYLDDIY